MQADGIINNLLFDGAGCRVDNSQGIIHIVSPAKNDWNDQDVIRIVTFMGPRNHDVLDRSKLQIIYGRGTYEDVQPIQKHCKE